MSYTDPSGFSTLPPPLSDDALSGHSVGGGQGGSGGGSGGYVPGPIQPNPWSGYPGWSNNGGSNVTVTPISGGSPTGGGATVTPALAPSQPLVGDYVVYQNSYGDYGNSLQMVRRGYDGGFEFGFDNGFIRDVAQSHPFEVTAMNSYMSFIGDTYTNASDASMSHYAFEEAAYRGFDMYARVQAGWFVNGEAIGGFLGTFSLVPSPKVQFALDVKDAINTWGRASVLADAVRVSAYGPSVFNENLWVEMGMGQYHSYSIPLLKNIQNQINIFFGNY
ncbi:MAG: hypothetical protein Q8J78_05140 [Moraxellaceae bacterium]|nr:hypothetical protein [Moraxellaceae bacterium]